MTIIRKLPQWKTHVAALKASQRNTGAHSDTDVHEIPRDSGGKFTKDYKKRDRERKRDVTPDQTKKKKKVSAVQSEKAPAKNTGTGKGMQKYGSGADTKYPKSKAEGQKSGENVVCPECKLNHTWEQCSRNAESPHGRASTIPFKGSGPHPWTLMPDYVLGIEKSRKFKDKYSMMDQAAWNPKFTKKEPGAGSA